jgi:hypothetical protein
MDGDKLRQRHRHGVMTISPPEIDEFDLDVRLGELNAHGGLSWLGIPFAAQTDPQCVLPTGGQGAGTTCNTQDNTCPATCAELNTCPNTCPQTHCQTCQTCPTQCNTCPQTDCQTCDCHTNNQHVNTCRPPCEVQ